MSTASNCTEPPCTRYRAAKPSDQPGPFGFVWRSPGPGHNLHINEPFKGSGFDAAG